MRRFVCALVVTLIGVRFAAARAGEASPETAPAAPPALSANFDPCGGPRELLIKFGVTPCVVVGGEAIISAGYISTKANGNIQLGTLATLPATALARIYPQALVTVGLSSRTDVQFTPPTYARVDTAHFPLVASGATDFQIGFKQRVAFDPLHRTMTSVAASVEFPTGSPAFRAPGPAYSGELIGSYAFPRRFSLIYDLQLSDAAANNSQQRNMTLSLTGIASYLTSGNFLAAAGAVILPSGVVTPMLIVEQLTSRHLGVQFFYAGMGTGFVSSTQTDLPAISAINIRGSVNVLGANVFALVGRRGP